MTDILKFYKEYQQRLSWLGGNFNQAQHSANELAITGELSPEYYRNVILPRTQEVMKLIRSVKSELDSIHDHIEGKEAMIITILPSSGDFHAVAYNEKKVEKGLAELLFHQNIPLRPESFNADNLREFFNDYSKRNNSRTKNAQFHVSVSCKGTEYTHQQLLEIGKVYLNEMGYAEEGQPVIVYAHHDTPNNHIHIITSRIAPDGHRISDKFEKKRSRQVTLKIMQEYTGERQEPTLNEIAAQTLAYRYTSKAQFCSILNSLGYETADDDSKPTLHIYKGDEEVGTIPVQLIMQHALRENKTDDKRRRQRRAILKKYRDLSANKEELAATMKKKFGISLVYLGRKDNPFGYVVVDHKNKTVFKGGDYMEMFCKRGQ